MSGGIVVGNGFLATRRSIWTTSQPQTQILSQIWRDKPDLKTKSTGPLGYFILCNMALSIGWDLSLRSFS